jgi:hypothetical protein
MRKRICGWRNQNRIYCFNHEMKNCKGKQENYFCYSSFYDQLESEQRCKRDCNLSSSLTIYHYMRCDQLMSLMYFFFSMATVFTFCSMLTPEK